jgi:aspartokinase/homoserine dehydrogenase 1
MIEVCRRREFGEDSVVRPLRELREEERHQEAPPGAGSGRATVGLVELDRSHPFANINLTDNIVRFVTSRYDRNPLVIQGPGAGPAVTAGGVFADLLRVCAYLGAKL